MTSVPEPLPRAATAEGQAGLDAILADPARALIATDFDGTLAPIVADPADAAAAPGAAAALTIFMASIAFTLSVTATAYGVGRVSTGHRSTEDIVILIVGLAASTLLIFVFVRRHRRHDSPIPRDR